MAAKNLTAKQKRFAVLLAQGRTQADSYRMAYDAENMTAIKFAGKRAA